MPQHLRPSLSAATSVVPDPANGSYTSPWWLRMGLAIASSGFRVPWSVQGSSAVAVERKFRWSICHTVVWILSPAQSAVAPALTAYQQGSWCQ